MDELAKLKDKICSQIKPYPKVDIELEARFKIMPPILFESHLSRTITYYKSLIYPSVTFRKYDNDLHIHTKELIDKRNNMDVLYALSIEKIYNHFTLKLPLIESYKVKQERMIICKNPLAEIIKTNNEYRMEIEYETETIEKTKELIYKYKSNYYPRKKPKEISISNLTKLLRNPKKWIFSFKADGIHVLVLEKGDALIIMYDNGTLTDINGNLVNMIEPENIYEAELMDDNELLYYDTLMHEYQDMTNYNIHIRRNKIQNKKLKEIFYIETLEDLRKILYYVPNFKCDGFIITDSWSTYKSKFVNTVDLKYKNGFLHLENEDISDKIPRTNYDYVNDKIYEFDMKMNLLKERDDKVIANYKFPYEDNPLYKIAFGIGVPSLRRFHNIVKYEMLKKLGNSVLLDIGSGKGGDMYKWINIKFKKIYAIDPNINFRTHNKKIIEIKEKAENIPDFIKYDNISILFVPWNDSFISLIKKAKKAIIAIMEQPKTHICDAFTCLVNGNNVTLKIPYSATAENIEENIIKIDDIKHLGKIEKLEFNMISGTEDEKLLASFYSYYIINVYQ